MNKKHITMARCFVLISTVFSCHEILAMEKGNRSKREASEVPNILSIVEFASAEQRRLFGAIPDWKVQEKDGECIFLSTHYLINDVTNERDKSRSVVAALYRCGDEDRYKLRFVFRKRGSETCPWEEDEGGCCTIILRGSEIVVDFDANSHFTGGVDIKVRNDSKAGRYFLINISSKGWHDELRPSIPSH